MPVQPGIYRIKNARTNTYVDNSRLDQEIVHGSGPSDENNQKWILNKLTNEAGIYTIKNMETQRWLYVMSSSDGTTVKANKLPTATLWEIRQDSDAYGVFVKGTNVVMDLDEGSAKDGTIIHLWGFWGAEWQKWVFEPVE